MCSFFIFEMTVKLCNALHSTWMHFYQDIEKEVMYRYFKETDISTFAMNSRVGVLSMERLDYD